MRKDKSEDVEVGLELFQNSGEGEGVVKKRKELRISIDGNLIR